MAFVEWVHVLVGRNIWQFRNFRYLVERAFSAPNCRGVITWCEPAKRAIIENLDSKSFRHKIHVVPLAVRPKDFVKEYHDEKVNLLFVGSVNTPYPGYDFLDKSGIEMLEAFGRLTREFDFVNLTIRANVPMEIRYKYRNLPNLRIINRFISKEELASEYMSADILLQPNHITPFGAFLEGMSYELPVVTRDASLNSEIVKDGLDGFVVPGGERINYFWDGNGFRDIPIGVTPKAWEFQKALRRVDPVFVDNLSERIRFLVENPGARRRMGRYGRSEVERGTFSIANRNIKLKKIFDEALN